MEGFMSKRTLNILSECIPIFTMLQDENRQQILILLFDNESMTVSELTDRLSLSRPAVSHHMKLLLNSGVVTVVKSGKERMYSLDMQKTVDQLKNLLASIESDMNVASK